MTHRLILVALVSILNAPGIAQQPGVLLPLPRHRFIVIAHRGAHLEYPENSLAAFREGIRLGVDFVEADLRTTRDSVLVVMHDATVDRTTDGKGRIDQLTADSLRRLRLRFRGEAAGAIPGFEEVLAACKDKVNIYLDFKSAGVARTVALIRKYGMEKQVVVYLNDTAQYTEWQRVAPTFPLMASLPDSIKTASSLKVWLAGRRLDLLDGDFKGYDTEMVQQAKELGIAVWPDIQGPEEAAHWDQALRLGLTGLQTDHPAELIRFLEGKGLR